MMKTKIKTRIASQAETLRWVNTSVPEADREAMKLPNGNPNACRLVMTVTGAPLLNKDGSQQYCAPWLLSGIFA